MKKLSFYLSIFLSFYLSISKDLKAQPIFGDPHINNCFQKITNINGKKITLLNDSINPNEFYISGSNVYPWVRGYSINTYNSNINVFTYPIIVPDTMLVKNSINSPLTNYVNVYEIKSTLNSDFIKITLDNYTPGDSIEITTIRGSGNNPYIAYKNKVTFVNKENLKINITPKNGNSCIKYNDPNFTLSFPELEGLCDVEMKLTLNDSNNNYGVPNNYYSLSINPFELFEPKPKFNPIPANCAYPPGQTPTTAPNLPNPVPDKCTDFDLNIKVKPCENAPHSCLPLLLKKKVKICCSCDIRPPASQN